MQFSYILPLSEIYQHAKDKDVTAHATKAYAWWDIYVLASPNWTPAESEWSAPRSGRFTSEKEPQLSDGQVTSNSQGRSGQFGVKRKSHISAKKRSTIPRSYKCDKMQQFEVISNLTLTKFLLKE